MLNQLHCTCSNSIFVGVNQLCLVTTPPRYKNVISELTLLRLLVQLFNETMSIKTYIKPITFNGKQFLL